MDKATGGDKLYGYLFLISGDGATTAVFEGDLMYFVETSSGSGVFEPEEPAGNLEISATLVSKAQREAGFFTFVDGNAGKIDTGPNYGAEPVTGTFKEAVQKYSHFTDDATYGKPSFSLDQQTAFLFFSLRFDDSVTGEMEVNITNNGGSSTILTHQVTLDAYHQAEFVVALPGGSTTLSTAKVTVTDVATGGNDFNKTKTLSSLTLEGNKYYNVVKTFLDLSHFTILSRNDAAMDITFNSNYTSDIEYSIDGGTWTTGTSSPMPVNLPAGKSIRVRGKRSSYADGPLFSSTEPCYIYGDIMSLFYDASYTSRSSAFSAGHELDGAFKGMTDLDIHPARPLFLSAGTLSSYCYNEMFSGSGITRTPDFTDEEGNPVTSAIPEGACKWMFKGCTQLATASELPEATTIGANGYFGMYADCSVLQAPPRTITGNLSGANACQQMFLGCSSLQYAPDLPSTTIPTNGYKEMFSGCSSLLEGPEIAATSIGGESACAFMFSTTTVDAVEYPACVSMGTGPSQLKATIMKNNCYQSMFAGCTSLQVAPEILAETVVRKCFQEMFSGCSMLRSIPQEAFNFTSSIGEYSCYRMFYMCSALNGAPNMPNVSGTINANGCQEMYAECAQMRSAPAALNATKVNASGYKQMFFNCKWIQVAPSISATDIGNQGCAQMFQGCERLVTPPTRLPATTLGGSAYNQMFSGCTQLGSAPTFPSEKGTLSGTQTCYRMFENCKALTAVSGQLFSEDTVLTEECFHGFFRYCSGLSSVPVGYLPSVNMAKWCYRGMFEETAITTAPDLPATTLANECYRYMFYACKSLSSIRCLATNPGGSTTPNFTGGGVAASGTFYKKAGVTSWPTGANGIPNGWTVVEE